MPPPDSSPPSRPTGTHHVPSPSTRVKLPSPPRTPPFCSTLMFCREPSVGKSGWSSVARVTPTESWLWTPGGRPKSEVSSTSLNSSYFVREMP